MSSFDLDGVFLDDDGPLSTRASRRGARRTVGVVLSVIAVSLNLGPVLAI